MDDEQIESMPFNEREVRITMLKGEIAIREHEWKMTRGNTERAIAKRNELEREIQSIREMITRLRNTPYRNHALENLCNLSATYSTVYDEESGGVFFQGQNEEKLDHETLLLISEGLNRYIEASKKAEQKRICQNKNTKGDTNA